MVPGRPELRAPEPSVAKLEQALRRVVFVSPPSTWRRVRLAQVAEAARPARAVATGGVILLCLIIMAASVYLFNRVLLDLLTGPV